MIALSLALVLGPTACERGSAPDEIEPADDARGSFARVVDVGHGRMATLFLRDLYDPAVASDRTPPAPGRRLVAARIDVANDGDAPLRLSLGGAFTALDGSGRSHEAILARVAGCPEAPNELVVASGSTASTCAVFAVPTAARIALLRFSGHGDRAEWAI
jgi:hypothetical protein